jgi:hypothetical protein
VNDSRLVVGMAVVFGGMTLLMLVLTAVFRDPMPLFVAVMFGAATYFFWYQVSGKMQASIYERVERRARVDGGGRRRATDGRGGFGAGPREEWTPPGGEERWEYRYQQQRGGRRGRTGAEVAARDGPTDREAYATLGLDPGADEAAVRRAYRERAKETHPDTGDGDEDEFKEVTAAYEQLTN